MMDSKVSSLIETDESILTFDVPDDALERAAMTDGCIVTLINCTQDWYTCGFPL